MVNFSKKAARGDRPRNRLYLIREPPLRFLGSRHLRMPIAQKTYAFIRRNISSFDADEPSARTVHDEHFMGRDVHPAKISDIAVIDRSQAGILPP